MSRCLLFLAALLLLISCRSTAAVSSDPAPTRVVLVRHAEADADGTRNPALSEAGRARAERLARALADYPFAAVYATEYRRTQETATPAATRAGIEVTLAPFGRGPAEAYAAQLAGMIRQLPAGSDVLIVGHSNTTPAVAAVLAGQEVAAMGETEYDRLIVVTLHADGRAELRETRYE